MNKKCEKGIHKLRENKFGVVWCVKCGLLSNTSNAPKLQEFEIIKYKNNETL